MRVIAAFASVLLCLASVPQTASAQESDRTVLLESRDWYVVYHTADADGDPFCMAATENDRGQEFKLLRWEVMTILAVSDDTWDIEERDLEFDMAIGRSRWNMQGKGKDDEVYLRIDRDDDFPELLSDLRRSNTARLSNADGKQLATFSLAGSSAAIGEMELCVERYLKVPSRDPFANDPF